MRDIESFDDLMAHPVNGASWEGFVIENITTMHPRWKASYIRTSNDAEVDLLIERGQQRILVECKLSKAPGASRGFRRLIADLHPTESWIAAPVDEAYPLSEGVRVGHVHHIRMD